MRILQIVALLSPDGAYGGPARVALNQCAELRTRGHDVTLAAGTRGYPVVPTERDGVPLRLFDARTMLPGLGLPGSSAPGLMRWFRTTVREFDIVHIHFGRDLVSVPVAAVARRYGIPYVLQTHGMVIPSRHPLSAPLDAMWTRTLLRDAKAVLYLTPQERDQLVSVAKTPLRLVALNNGVPEYPEQAAPWGSNPAEVIYLARMHARKRPMVFVGMARALLAQGVDARFTLIGPDEGEGARLRNELVGERRICWEGSLTPEDVPGRLARAAVFVLPSVREPYPMSVLEAMSVGRPVVIHADCGLAPIVEAARCGIVVDGGPDVFAAAVRSILADRDAGRAMGDRGRTAARMDFGMGSIGDRLMNVYQ